MCNRCIIYPGCNIEQDMSQPIRHSSTVHWYQASIQVRTCIHIFIMCILCVGLHSRRTIPRAAAVLSRQLNTVELKYSFWTILLLFLIFILSAPLLWTSCFASRSASVYSPLLQSLLQAVVRTVHVRNMHVHTLLA